MTECYDLLQVDVEAAPTPQANREESGGGSSGYVHYLFLTNEITIYFKPNPQWKETYCQLIS